MQVTENSAEGLKRALTVTIPATDLSSRLADRLDEMRRQAHIKGFRPGKVPVQHLRKLYGKAAMAEIVQSLVSETSTQALTERGEKAATQPDIAMTEDEKEADTILAGEADLVYTMEYEVLPDFEVSEFKNIKVARRVADVSDTDVEERLQQIGQSSRPFQSVDRAAKADDRVTISYVGKIDGEPFEGGTDNETPIVIGSGQFIPGFEDQLVGLKAGDEKTIDVTFPTTYQAEHLAGKPANFEVKVKTVEEPGEVVIDEAFATNLGLESLDKLKETVRDQVQSEFGQATRQGVKRQILDALDEKYTFELPERLVEQEFNNIWHQVMHDVEHHGKSFEDEGTTEDEARAEYRTISERRVRLGLVLSRIGEEADVSITEEELQRVLFEQVRRYPGQEQQVMEHYRNNPEAMQSLRAPIYEEKVIDYILEFAEIEDKTVSKDELFADDDDDHKQGHDHHDH